MAESSHQHMDSNSLEENGVEASHERRFHFNWIPAVLFRPRQGLARVAALNRPSWLTPLLALTITALALVLASGWLERHALLRGEMDLPPNFEFYSQEQQAQYLSSVQARQGPVFIFVIPALAKIAGLWLGWLVLGGMLHLVLTLLGGRGDTGGALNLVGWASLPFAVRDLVRVVYLLATQHNIAGPGLAGFGMPEAGSLGLLIAEFLKLVDIYLVWYLVLMILGVRAYTGLKLGKAVTAVLITVLLSLLVQVGIGFGIAKLGSLSFAGSYFF